MQSLVPCPGQVPSSIRPYFRFDYPLSLWKRARSDLTSSGMFCR